MKTVLISGANRGIGLELAKLYKSQNLEVITLVRQVSAELEKLGTLNFINSDVTDDESLKRVARDLEGKKIDILINNAGILRSSSVSDFNFQGMMEQFQVNSMAPIRVTSHLLNNLDSGSKVAMITSRMGSMADNTSGGTYGYRMSKAALNAASVSLAQDLKPQGIAVGILHPGWVQTDMTGGTGHLRPEESAANLAKRIEELNLENSGTFWHCNGEKLPW